MTRPGHRTAALPDVDSRPTFPAAAHGLVSAGDD